MRLFGNGTFTHTRFVGPANPLTKSWPNASRTWLRRLEFGTLFFVEMYLATYERPLNAEQPVVCVDEKPVQVLADVRAPVPARKPGRIAKQDNEYKRCGTANIFCGVEPKSGRNFTEVTPTRSGAEFAQMMQKLARAYPE